MSADVLHFRVDEIPDGGAVARHGEFSPAFLADLELDPAVLEPAPGGALDVEISRVGQTVQIRGTAHMKLLAHCVRCLADVDLAEAVPVELTALPRPARGRHDDADEAEEDEGVAWYDPPAVDIAAGVREQVLLALPRYPLCSETCRGLCPQCGQNLNEGECSHHAAEAAAN